MDTLPSFTYQRFSSRTDARSAFDTVIETARHQICLYDRDGEFYGLDRPVVTEHLSALLRYHPQARVRIVLQKIDELRTSSPRLIELMQRHGPQIEVRRLDEKLTSYQRGYLLADSTVVMRRPHFDQSIAFWDISEAEITSTERLFSELWDNAPETLSVSVTGL